MEILFALLWSLLCIAVVLTECVLRLLPNDLFEEEPEEKETWPEGADCKHLFWKSNRLDHEYSAECWCRPRVYYYEMSSLKPVWVHREPDSVRFDN